MQLGGAGSGTELLPARKVSWLRHAVFPMGDFVPACSRLHVWWSGGEWPIWGGLLDMFTSNHVRDSPAVPPVLGHRNCGGLG